MLKTHDDAGHASSASSDDYSCDGWTSMRQNFLEAVSEHYRPQVAALLNGVNNSGAGLREWLAAAAWRGSVLPATIPDVLIDIYIYDSEAMPLHDCEGCGVAIPVRPDRLYGPEADPERIYFRTCPICGSRTGPYMYYGSASAKLRRRPR